MTSGNQEIVQRLAFLVGDLSNRILEELELMFKHECETLVFNEYLTYKKISIERKDGSIVNLIALPLFEFKEISNELIMTLKLIFTQPDMVMITHRKNPEDVEKVAEMKGFVLGAAHKGVHIVVMRDDASSVNTVKWILDSLH